MKKIQNRVAVFLRAGFMTFLYVGVALFLVISSSAIAGAKQYISTFAGGGVGDGGPGTNACVNQPHGVAVDSTGNVYIADTLNNLIRKVDPTSGFITTVAGNGIGGYAGDGGPATSASLSSPSGVAVDSAGNLYIADTNNNVIRKVDTSGNITTVAGNFDKQGYAGDNGPATSASLFLPTGVAVDSAINIYIADSYNNVIREVYGPGGGPGGAASGNITTVAGNASAGYTGDGVAATSTSLNYPYGVAVDPAFNLYVADAANNRIRKVDTSGIISTVAGSGTAGYGGDGGSATSASAYLNSPEGVALDSQGNLYIADYKNNVIRKVDTSGNITTVAGNGTQGYAGDGSSATSASLFGPVGVAVDSAFNLYIADTFNNRIREVASGNITTIAGNGSARYGGDGSSATSASLSVPEGVAVDSQGNIYIADTNNNVIRKVDTSGNITTVAGNGSAGYGGDGRPATSASLNFPCAVAVDSTGNIYIADLYNYRIRKVDTSGTITTVAGNGGEGYGGDGGAATSTSLASPEGVAVDSTGNIYIADFSDNRVLEVNTSGIITTVAGGGPSGYSGDGGPATSASLNNPRSVAVDSTGNIYIADHYNNVIREVYGPGGGPEGELPGNIITVAGNGTEGYGGDGRPATSASLNGPNGVAVDSSGNFYIADLFNSVIRKVDTSGIITTVAGNGTVGYGGDGGPATSASLNAPSDVAVDPTGNIYIADANNNRIRRVSPDVCGGVTQPSGLVSWWQAEDNANDALGLHNGTLMNGAAFAPGEVGQAFSLSGASQYVSLPNATILGSPEWTIETWFNTPSGGVIAGTQTGPYGPSPAYWDPLLYVGTDGKLYGGIWTTVPVQVVSSQSVADGKWHHAAMSVGNGTVSVYLDGSLLGSVPGIIKQTMPVNQIGSGYTEYWPETNGDWFDFAGEIDEFGLFNVVLTPCEINAIYLAGSAGLCAASTPTVTSTIPISGATGVPFSAVITATFCEAMNATTINTTNFTVSAVTGTVTGAVSYDTGTNTATFGPSANLTYNTTYTATVMTGVQDSAGNAMAANYVWSFTTGCPTITISPSTLSSGTQGTLYVTTLTASGGAAPYTLSVASGTLPPGLSYVRRNNTAGDISGTPTTSGTFNFTVTATDANGCTGSQAYTIVITGCPTITLSPPSLPNGTTVTDYSQTITASGGSTPYTYAVTLGSLPAGLFLNSSTGGITGTPTTAGTFNFTVTATDANGCQGSQAYTISACPTITLFLASSPNGIIGIEYTTTVTASGGAPPYTLSVVSGALPPGLSLNSSTGGITGTPTTAGTFNFTVTAIDANGCTGSQAYSLIISECTYHLNLVNSLIAYSGGTGYNFVVTAHDGCPWTAASSQSWIQITSGSSGSGSGTVTYTVNANSGSARSGAVTVAGQTFTVTQSDTTLQESLTLPTSPAMTPGIPYWVTLTLYNKTGKNMLTFRPDCVNTNLMLKDAYGNIVSQNDRLKGYAIPADLVTILTGGSFTITCDLSAAYSPSVFQFTGTQSYTLGATYANYFQDPTKTYTLWIGAIPSTPITVPIVGNQSGTAPASAPASVSLFPSQWSTKWATLSGLIITAQITVQGGVPDPTKPILLSGIPIIPGSNHFNSSGVFTANFDASAVINALGFEGIPATASNITAYPVIQGETTNGLVFSAQNSMVVLQNTGTLILTAFEETGSGSTIKKVLLEDLPIKVYDMSPKSCAAQLGTTASQNIWQSCVDVANGITDSKGQATFALPPGLYVAIGEFIDSSNKLNVGASLGVMTAGSVVNQNLQVIQTNQK